MLDVVGVVTELVEVLAELVVVDTLTVVVVVVVDWGVVTELVEVLAELVVVDTLTVVVVVVVDWGVVTELVEVLAELVVVVVDWFVGCGNGSIAMYIVPWRFVMFSSANHAKYSVLSMIDALGAIMDAVV
jgi:hypothetical protein